MKVMRHVHFGDPSPRRRREALDLAAEGGPPSRPGGAPLEVAAPPPSPRDRAQPGKCTPHKLGPCWRVLSASFAVPLRYAVPSSVFAHTLGLRQRHSSASEGPQPHRQMRRVMRSSGMYLHRPQD